MEKLAFQASLPVTFLREGDQFVAYTPALDLSTSTDSFEQAKTRFSEVVQIFFEECLNMGTLSKVLADLGWIKENSVWNPPTVVAQDMQVVRVSCFQRRRKFLSLSYAITCACSVSLSLNTSKFQGRYSHANPINRPIIGGIHLADTIGT